MKKYRRIEITAFHRRVAVVNGASPDGAVGEACVGKGERHEYVDRGSDEGRRILGEAMGLLQEHLQIRISEKGDE
jgi:hypothetical protein